MNYLLDTSTVSMMLEKASPEGARVMDHYRALSGEDAAVVSILTHYELATFVALRPEFAELQRSILEQLDVLAVPLDAADQFAGLKIGLARKTGAKVTAMGRHNFDLMLATTALANGYTLVSSDSLFRLLAEVEPAFKFEDWTA